MSSLPEGARRLKREGEDPDDDPDGPGPRPASVRAANGSGTKFDGIAAQDGLQRLGGSASGKYPVERRGTGSRQIQESEDDAPDAEQVPLPTDLPSPGTGSAEADDDLLEAQDGPGPVARQPQEGDRRLCSTGISGLDAQYGGGLPSGSLFLLTSEPTTATGIFAAQYAAAGLSEGEVVYYFSLEQPAAEVRRAIGTFVKSEKDLERLRIVDGYPNQFTNVPDDARHRMGIGKGENALAALESLLVNPKLTGPVRIIVESMSELLAQYEADRVFRVLRVLKGVAAALDGTAVVTLVSSLHDDRTTVLAKHIADGAIEFHVERKGFGIYPYIAVTKMRGVSGSARLLLFKETESGLWLESTKRVF